MASLSEGVGSPAIEQDPSIAQIQAAQLGAASAQQQVSLPATGFVAEINGEDGAITIQEGTNSVTSGTPDIDVNVTNGLGTISIGVDLKLWPAALAKSNTAVVAPTVTDDETQGYAIFSLWVDTLLSKIYMCTDPSTASANWEGLN